MRAETLPWLGSRLLGILAVCVIAAATAGGLLLAATRIEGKWFIAVVGGVSLLWLAIASGRFERFLLGLFFFVIPINADVNWYPTLYRWAKSLELSAMDLVLCGLYAAWIARLVVERPSRTIRWPSGATPLLCLIGWGGLSIVNARDPVLSSFLLLAFAKSFLGFLYVANHVKTREDLWLVARCLVAGLILEGLIGCVQHVTGSPLGLDALGEQRVLIDLDVGGETVSRVMGTLGHPNDFGKYLEAVVPLALALTFAPVRMRTRLMSAGAFGLGAVVLVLTLSRGAWLSMAVACAVLVGWLLVHQRRSWVLPIGFMALTGLVIALCFTPLITARSLGGDSGTAESRLPLMRVAWSIIRSHPILGVGLNNYTTVMQLYDPTPEGISFRYPKPVHNIYLYLAAETGLMGLVWFVWFVWAAWRRGWQRIAASRDGLVRLILLGVACGLVARLAHGLVDVGDLGSKLPFLWLYPALLVARSASANE